MRIDELKQTLDFEKAGREMFDLMHQLYPICRSITGNGFRETLRVIQNQLPLAVHEIPSGTKVFDWTVPKEWNIRDAYVKDSKGDRIIDFRKSNLHIVGYSVPIRAKMSLAELKEHLHTLPDHPEWIPYRTSYYAENWGFCLSHQEFLKLQEDSYEVCIDSSLENGHLTYGESYLKGECSDEFLLSCHACHPSLCNDNLSGIALATQIGKYLSTLSLRCSYRILFIPGTIGSITWLSLNESHVGHIKNGLIVTGAGDPGRSTYKKSRLGDAEVDRAAEHVLRHSGEAHRILDFSPYGYDERQYCSPGFNLPIGCLQRTPYGEYPEYHTSADNFDLVRPVSLSDSLSKCLSIISVLENNQKYINTNPKCEPQLGKRGLYNAIGGKTHVVVNQMALLWVLNFSDGKHTLLEIAERSGMEFDAIKRAADILLEHDLIREC